MSTSCRQKDDDDVLAANGGSIEAMFADAEAELNATLNESIEDIERLNNQQPSEDLGTPAGAKTKAPAVRSATSSSSHIMDDEYEDNDNDDDGDDDVGAYSSFDDNDGDELSLDGEIEHLEGLAMEDLARELRDLESIMENSGDGDIGRQETTTRPAPFEDKGRRARARRARIKREIKAREERAKAKANDLRGGKGEKHTKQEVKKPLKSLGSTSSLGRALAASQAKSSSKSDNKQGASTGRPIGQGVRAKKGESKTNASNNSVERSEPFQGKGRRARARRAKERREKVAAQVENSENIGMAGDAIVDEFGEEKREEAVQKMQPITCKPTKREENKSVADVLKSRTFPDFSIREALS